MKITYVTDEGGDWAGLYIDGFLDGENHSLDVGMVLESLAGEGLFDYQHYQIRESAWDGLGSLPETEEEIPEAVKCD